MIERFNILFRPRLRKMVEEHNEISYSRGMKNARIFLNGVSLINALPFNEILAQVEQGFGVEHFDDPVLDKFFNGFKEGYKTLYRAFESAARVHCTLEIIRKDIQVEVFFFDKGEKMPFCHLIAKFDIELGSCGKSQLW